MNCEAFERWLDDGMPDALAAAARAHARGCARCAASLAAAEAIETSLLRASFTAPAGLTDRVMARVAAVEARRTAPVAAFAWQDAFPWWARAAADPAIVIATALCGILIWQWDAIARMGVTAMRSLEGAGTSLPGIAWTMPRLSIQITLAMLIVPAGLWLGQAAFRASERWMGRAAGHRA